MKREFKLLFETEMSNGAIALEQEYYEDYFDKLIDIAENYARVNERFAELLETYGATDGWLSHIPEIIGILNAVNFLD